MADSKQDYYEVLGVDKNATQDEIKSAYGKLCRIYHPDVAEDKKEAEIKFKEINEAYSVLGDEEKRQKYDQFGPDGANIGDMSDFMGGDFGFGGMGGFSSIFDMFGFGGGAYNSRPDRNAPIRGRDMRYDLELTLEEAFSGCKKDIEVETLVTCGACKGTRAKKGTSPQVCGACGGTGQVTRVTKSPFGQIMTQAPCPKCKGEGVKIDEYCDTCHGSGKMTKTKTLTIDIPAGVDTGSKIRLAGEGEGGTNGGDSGDLYVVIFIKEHEIFQRSRKDLFRVEQIDFPQAALGAELTIGTIDGEAKLKIPAGTQCDTVFKIKGKGMPAVNGSSRGDLYVKVWVMIPKKLNDKQKKALKEFSEASSGKENKEKDKTFLQKLKKAFTGKD